MRHIHEFHHPLNQEELEHLRTCPLCAQALADYVEAHEQIRAPGYLKQSIMEECQTVRPLLPAAANRGSKRLTLFLYSVKITAATAAALMFILTTPAGLESRGAGNTPGKDPGLHPVTVYQKARECTRQLGDFHIFTREVTDYDQKAQ